MKKIKTITVLLLLSLVLMLCSCGTVTTEQASAYSDDIVQTESAGDSSQKKAPIDTEQQKINRSQTGTCTLLIECSTILANTEKLNKQKQDLVPEDGILYAEKEVTFYEGESVFDVLQRETQDASIHMEFEWTPLYDSSYVSGIGNLYEFDCGELSGWTYSVNGWFPNYGASRYIVSQGDKIEWHYTCDLGKDVGAEMGKGK